MKKKSFLSFLFQIGAFCVLLLLLWSSTLVEEKIKDLQKQITDLKIKVEALKYTKEAPSFGKSVQKEAYQLPENNLLQEDPFYKTTLFSLLPKGFTPSGTYFSATVGRPENLLPFAADAATSSLQGLCTGSLGNNWIGFYERFAPDLAEAIEVKENNERNTIDYWVYLRKDLYWKPVDPSLFPGLNLSEHFLKPHPVTSADFKLQFDTVMNPHIQLGGALGLRPYLETIEEVEVINPHLFIIRWKTQDSEGKRKAQYSAKGVTISFSPLAGFLYKYYPDGTKIIENDEHPDTYRQSSLYAQALFQHWASQYIPSCGVWEFEGISDKEATFSLNSQYPHPFRGLFKKQKLSFKSSQNNIWKAFQAMQVDTCSLSAAELLEFEQFLNSDLYKNQKKSGFAIHSLRFPQRAFTYIGWNQKTPFFKEKKVRIAMTVAINRQRIIEQFLSGNGVETTGDFFIESPSYNKKITALPYDPYYAESLLDEAGFRFDPKEGVRGKVIDGQFTPLSFHLIYYVKNDVAKAIVDFISSSLRRIHVQCIPLGLDVADLSARLRSKDFSAVFMGWVQGRPPEDPRQLWHSLYADLPGSSNYVGFKNEEADQIIESLTYEDDAEKRVALYHRFHEILHEEQPYTFLYVPITTFLWRETVKNVFIPKERQDLIPGAETTEPVSALFYKED